MATKPAKKSKPSRAPKCRNSAPRTADRKSRPPARPSPGSFIACAGPPRDLNSIVTVVEQAGILAERIHRFLVDHRAEWYGATDEVDGRVVEAALLVEATVFHEATMESGLNRDQSRRFFERLASVVYCKYVMGAELVVADMRVSETAAALRSSLPTSLPIPPINSRGGGSA